MTYAKTVTAAIEWKQFALQSFAAWPGQWLNDNAMRLNSIADKGLGLLDWLTNRHETGPAAEGHDETSPFLVEFFLVQGVGFRCMAYRDFEGKWHHAFNNKELPGTVRVLE